MRRDEEEVCLGTVRWLGRLHELYGHQMVAGVILVSTVKTTLTDCFGKFMNMYKAVIYMIKKGRVQLTKRPKLLKVFHSKALLKEETWTKI